MIFNEIKYELSKWKKNGKHQKWNKNKIPKPKGQYLNKKSVLFEKYNIWIKNLLSDLNNQMKMTE